MKRSLILTSIFATANLISTAASSEILINTLDERAELLKQADVWDRPDWIEKDTHKFLDSYQLSKKGVDSAIQTNGEFIELGPDRDSSIAKALSEENVECIYNDERTQRSKKTSGFTPKFYCDLKYTKTTNDGIENKTKTIKIKYDNGEAYSEMAATRLMWALGFKADKMYSVKKLTCLGCPDGNPWRNQETYSLSKFGDNQVVFENVVAEQKFDAEEIEMNPATNIAYNESKGFDMGTLFNGFLRQDIERLPREDQDIAIKRKTQREALRLLAVFLQHGDNKSAQQRLACKLKDGSEDKSSITIDDCKEGKLYALIQDVGATFGIGSWTIPENPIMNFFTSIPSKVILESAKMNADGWNQSPFWNDAATCRANLNSAHTEKMDDPIISEEGRQFLATLLSGFIDGSNGEERLTALFTKSRADIRMARIRLNAELTRASQAKDLQEYYKLTREYDQNLKTQTAIELANWKNIFRQKVAELKNPVPENPNFSCPTSILDAE